MRLASGSPSGAKSSIRWSTTGSWRAITAAQRNTAYAPATRSVMLRRSTANWRPNAALPDARTRPRLDGALHLLGRCERTHALRRPQLAVVHTGRVAHRPRPQADAPIPPGPRNTGHQPP